MPTDDALQLGICNLCRQQMLYDPRNGDAWHPWDVERACPPEPKTFEGWQDFARAGLRPGRPGAQHFVRDPDAFG